MNAPPDPLLGATLGRYRITARLGAGAMGVVYRARDSALERDVALKLLPAGADDAARQSLLLEARLASSLNHPDICTIHEVGREDGRDFIAMELVEGTTLRDAIPGAGMPEETILRVGARIARALAHAHERGVVHRDFKTANVVLGERGPVKLLDFGLARRLSTDARTAAEEPLAGTPTSLAPEVLQGGPATAASDLWALGVALHEMCSGAPPFASREGRSLVTAILHDPPAPLPERASPEFREVVARCLAKSPAQRYGSAAEAAAALEAIESSRRPPARPPGPRRRIAFAAGVLTTIVVIAAFLAGRRSPEDGADVTVQVEPFEMRGDAAADSFAGRAFAEAVALQLAQSDRIRVMAVPARAAQPARGPAGLRRVTGALERDGDSLHVTIALVDPATDRLLWGDRAGSGADALASLARLEATRLAARLGGRTPKRYEPFLTLTGPPDMADSPELAEALGAVRRFDGEAAVAASARLVSRFPREPDARVLRLAALLTRARANAGRPPDAPSLREIRAAADTLRQLDERSPWPDLAAALCSPSGDKASLDALQGLLDRDDLAPATRAVVHASRADLLGAGGDRDGALLDAEQAVRLDPAGDLALSTLARWLSAAGRDADAAERVRQAIALNPTVANYHFQLANCLERAGRPREAEAQRTLAGELRDRSTSAR